MCFKLKDELNFRIDKENYIKDLQTLFNKWSSKEIILHKNEDGDDILECCIDKEIREKNVSIQISVCFDKSVLKNISLELIPEKNDNSYYDTELKLFYFEEIKGKLFNTVNREKKTYTLRCYKKIYNAFPLYGIYEINYDGKCLFHTLYEIEKNEPLTEHILAFDIEMEARSFEEARTKSYNKVAEICDFLSVLIDVGIYEPFSMFSNFVTTKVVDGTKCYASERYRTAIIDKELELFVKDNMNGLCPKVEVEKNNFMNGYFSLAFYSSEMDSADGIRQFKIGEISSIEKAFEKHRLYKVQKEHSKGDLSDKGIERHIHFANQKIEIPREIRKYYRGILRLKESNIKKYISFRNASRLYNRSKIINMNDGSMEIAMLVASVEALNKSEAIDGFTNFILKYNQSANRNELDDIYGIRSKFFHAGEFSFFEYNFDLNPYSNPIYKEFQDKYVRYKMIIRTAIVNWINENVLGVLPDNDKAE